MLDVHTSWLSTGTEAGPLARIWGKVAPMSSCIARGSRLGKGVSRRSLFAYVSYLFNSLTSGINYDRENAK